MNEYRVKVTIRNNLLLSAIEDAGYKSQADFARSCGLNVSSVNNLVAMREAPLCQSRGEFSSTSKIIMEVLGACPTDLWTDKQLSIKLKTNTGERVVSEVAVQSILDNHIGQMTLSDPADDYSSKQKVDVVQNALSGLTGREQDVITMRFSDEMTLNEIAQEYGVSNSRIMQIEAKALRKLRHPKTAEKLREFA